MSIVRLLILLFFTPLAFAYDFKGIAIGEPATPDLVQEKLGVECGLGGSGRDMQICNGDVTIAGESAYMNLVISPLGVVQRIHLSLSPDAFDIVAPLLVEKFGPPSSTDRSEIQNRMGAKFDQVIYLWEDKHENQILYSRYSGSVDTSSLNFSTEEDREMIKKVMGDPKSDI